MTRLNFKKMYLISEEKYQTLTNAPSQSRISNINNQSSISSENRPNDTPIIYNQNHIDPHTQSNKPNNETQDHISCDCRCKEVDQHLSNSMTSDKSMDTNTKVRTPFRKILTRKYKFKESMPSQGNLNSNKKRKRCKFNVDRSNEPYPSTTRTKNKNKRIYNFRDINSLVNSRQKPKWLKLE